MQGILISDPQAADQIGTAVDLAWTEVVKGGQAAGAALDKARDCLARRKFELGLRGEYDPDKLRGYGPAVFRLAPRAQDAVLIALGQTG